MATVTDEGLLAELAEVHERAKWCHARRIELMTELRARGVLHRRIGEACGMSAEGVLQALKRARNGAA